MFSAIRIKKTYTYKLYYYKLFYINFFSLRRITVMLKQNVVIKNENIYRSIVIASLIQFAITHIYACSYAGITQMKCINSNCNVAIGMLAVLWTLRCAGTNLNSHTIIYTIRKLDSNPLTPKTISALDSVT